jgi:hypothetical protein
MPKLRSFLRCLVAVVATAYTRTGWLALTALLAPGCTSNLDRAALLPLEEGLPGAARDIGSREPAVGRKEWGNGSGATGAESTASRFASYLPVPASDGPRQSLTAGYSPASNAPRPASYDSAAPLYPTTLKLNADGPLQKALRPSNDRIWSPDQAVLPYAEFQGERVKVHNIRNSEYRTVDDYTVHHYDKTFDLRKIKSVDFIQVPFADTPSIAHVMLSFGFEDKDYVVLSVEIRKEKGEAYSAAKGFFNQYELMYVLADERDVLWKNSIGWLCEVYVWRTKATPQQARELFVDVMRRVNKLRREPEFYNTLTNNCTTNIRQHINHLAPDRVPYDYRVLLPGYSDKLAYDLGLFATTLPYEEAKAKARVNYQAYLYRDDPSFSVKIRRTEGGEAAGRRWEVGSRK